MFHNVFSNINANLQKCSEINVDDIRQGSSGSLHDREQCQYLQIHSLNIFHMMTHFDELKLFIETNKPDIIGISETKLDKTINDCDIHVPGYRVIRKDRNCYGGGVLMYLNESLNVKCNILKAYPISADTDSKAVSHLSTFSVLFFLHTNSSTGP